MKPTIFSTGHSNHELADFVSMLTSNDIQVVVDVRSEPVSGYSPHFNQKPLQAALAEVGIRYVFLGKELGGRPEGDQFYDEDGRVFYNRVAESQRFEQGLERLLQGASEYRVTMMCSEEKPDHCHRHLLVAEVLRERGLAEVRHIRRGGLVESDSQIKFRPTRGVVDLFEEEESEWRSIQPVLRSGPHETSSPRSTAQE